MNRKTKITAVTLLGLALMASPVAAHASGESDNSTVEVYWAMPNGGTPENVTWPQAHAPNGATECGVWYQVDTYLSHEAPGFYADGILEHGEDWGNKYQTGAISWRFEYGGDCVVIPPKPEEEVETRESSSLNCEENIVIRTVEGRHTLEPTYDASTNTWTQGPWSEWEVIDIKERQATAEECEVTPTPTPTPTVPTANPPTPEDTDTVTTLAETGTPEWLPFLALGALAVIGTGAWVLRRESVKS